MFREVELQRKVGVHIPIMHQMNQKKKKRVISRSYIVTRLLEDLAIEKATKDEGYFVSVTQVEWIGEGELMRDEEEEEEEVMEVVFPVAFKCRSFLPIKGEILEGTVYRTSRVGVFLRCGPLKIIFLSALKMPGFRLCEDKRSRCQCRLWFVDEKVGKIDVGAKVRFVVLDLRWNENNENGNMKGYNMLASLVPADSSSSSPGLLGPVPPPPPPQS